jgi:hypothetical protein
MIKKRIFFFIVITSLKYEQSIKEIQAPGGNQIRNVSVFPGSGWRGGLRTGMDIGGAFRITSGICQPKQSRMCDIRIEFELP